MSLFYQKGVLAFPFDNDNFNKFSFTFISLLIFSEEVISKHNCSVAEIRKAALPLSVRWSGQNFSL